MSRLALTATLLLVFAPLTALQAQHAGARGRLEGERSTGSVPIPTANPRRARGQVGATVQPGEEAGRLSSPTAPDRFVTVEELLKTARRKPGGIVEAQRPLLWPQGAAPEPRRVRVFVQGLNTPRPDDPSKNYMGADARLRRYLAQGYVRAPVIAFHNGTALELPEGARSGRSIVANRLPRRRQDFWWSVRLRLTKQTKNPQTQTELQSLARLILGVLADPKEPFLHLIGYSDGSLVVEEALARAANTLLANQTPSQVWRLMRYRVFVEAWGNATPPRVAGPRRLLIHEIHDGVAGRRLLTGGGKQMGVLRAADLPEGFARETRIVSFDSPYGEDKNNHNSLTTIGPALKAIFKLHGVKHTEGLWAALERSGRVHSHYRELRVDWGAFTQYRWD